MKKEKFDITGMTCSACSARVHKAVSKLEGIEDVNVNLLKNSMIVTFDNDKTSEEDIAYAVEKAGYGAQLNMKTGQKSEKSENKNGQLNIAEKEAKEVKLRLIVSILFTVPIFYLAMGHMMNWPLPQIFTMEGNMTVVAFTEFLLLLPVLFVNFKYYKIGISSLFHRAPNMDTLIALGSGAATLYGIFAIYKIAMGYKFSDIYFESAAMILALITLGKYFEARAKKKTSDAIEKLGKLTPKTATVLRDNKEITIDTKDVVLGDIVIIKSGETIAVDGEIIYGNGSIDESAITGEPIPVYKEEGDKVIGGSISKSGYFQMKAEKVGEDTTLAQIIKLVDEATSSKAPIAKLADKVSGIFVPVVIAIALITFITWLAMGKSLEFAMTMAISVLVISCPCALGLATPTAIMVGTGKGAENGILIKSAESLEKLHSVDTVVLDKTGTVTFGKPEMTGMLMSGKYKYIKNYTFEFMNILCSLEKFSEHPIGKAILAYRYLTDLDKYEVENWKQVEGKGIRGEVNGKLYFAGNKDFVAEALQLDLKSTQKTKEIENYILELFKKGDIFASQGDTPIYLADENTLIGLVTIADVIKPTSKKAVDELRKEKIDVVMLTGDNEKTARYIGEASHIKNIIAGVLPQHKESYIRKLQEEGKKVAMVGDGINDAPALARADVGIAIGAGTDIAISSADIVLMKDDLLDVPISIRLSKKVMANIKENLFWAFFYNVIGIPIAAGVFFASFGLKLSPMIAAGAMSFSSICVVSNALRLRFFKSRSNIEEEEIFSSKDNLNSEIKVDKEGDITMKKTISIEGMMCQNCVKHVDKALTNLLGASEVKVDLEGNKAEIVADEGLTDEAIKEAIEDAGYEVTSIK